MASDLKQIYFSLSGSSGTVLFWRVFHRILFQAFIPLNVSTFYGLLHWNTQVYFIFTELYLINYLSPRALFHIRTCTSTFSTFRKNYYFLFNVKWKLFQLFGQTTIFFLAFKWKQFSKKAFITGKLLSTKFIFTENLYLQSSFLRRVANSTSVFFLFLFNRTRHGGVGQRSGTRLETPLLGWALPLKILNHTSLDVDVPVFLHPGDITSSFHFFSWFSIPSRWSPDT